MSKYLHGVHDIDGAELMREKPGWILITEAIGSDPHDHSGRDYEQWTRQGFSILCRLNNGYSPAGTIPHSNHYEDFARRCGNFVRATPGITVAIIGNEPNHMNERPNGELIIPTQYAKCFDLCYKQIKNNASHVKICTAAIAPWDATTPYAGNSLGDWVTYHVDMLNAIQKTDAISLHTYTHGAEPTLITDNSTMDPPFETRHYNFRAYVDFLVSTPLKYQYLPIYITETDQVNPWKDTNLGWVQEAYEEIDFWNHTVENQKIHCLCIYRTNRDDQWSIADKGQVKADFRQAVDKGYRVPEEEIPPDAGNGNGNGDGDTDEVPPVNPNPDPDRDIDPALIARGVEFHYASVPVGTGYWKIVRAVHLDEQEADAVGPDHHILGTIEKDGRDIGGVRFRVDWPSGHTPIISKDPQVTIDYNYDFPMTSSLNEFSIRVDDGNASDLVRGIGMGAHGNPSIHTSTWIDWEWTVAHDIPIPIPPIPPIPPPLPAPTTKLVHPLSGSVITQHFYQNPEDYAKFGMPGHNGTDLGGRLQGTSVVSVADGVVAYSDYDAAYGNYVRVAHRQNDMMCYLMYAHLQNPGTPMGTRVTAGQEIGLLGTTGNSTGVHLHIEVRMMNQDGTYMEGAPMPKGRIDPQTFFFERGLRL